MANIILNASSLRLGTRQGCHFSLLLCNLIIEVLSSAIRHEKCIKTYRLKREKKFYLYNALIYVENLREFTNKLMAQISGFSKVAGYNVNMQKATVFIYISNVELEFKIYKTGHLP